MSLDLERWFLDGGQEGRPRVELFVSKVLVKARVWSSLRDTDGIGRVRWVTLAPTSAQAVGQFESLEPADHLFWLEVSAQTDTAQWALDYRPVGLTERTRRYAIDLFNDREQIAWELSFYGSATLRDGELSGLSVNKG